MRKIPLVVLVGAALSPLASNAQSVQVIPPRSLATGESRVELHGVLDSGIESAHMGNGTTTRLTSGAAGGSRLGLRGTEDLGSGYRAIFELEMRIELDTGRQTSTSPFVSSDLPTGTFPGGTSSAIVSAATPAVVAGQQALQRVLATVNTGSQGFFDRQAFVGIVTPYGAILGGRMYTPGYEVLNAYNVFGDATAGQFGQNFALLTIRANNALAYRARFFQDLVITAMYSFGGNETQGGGRDERVAPPQSADDFFGANVRWTRPTYDVGIGYNRNNTVRLATSESVKGLETLNIGGSMQFGPTRIYAQFMKRKNDNPVFEGLPTPFNIAQFNVASPLLSIQDAEATVGQAGKTDMYAYHLGAAWRIGNGTIAVAANRGDDRRPINADVGHYAIGYFHDLSRRTTLYTAYAHVNNSANSRMGINSAGYSGGYVDRSGYDPNVFQLGLRHIF